MRSLDDIEATWSIRILPDGWVRVHLIGGVLNAVQPPELADLYHDVDEMPEWAREKLYALYTIRPDPSHSVVGVGRRLSTDSYWITYQQE